MSLDAVSHLTALNAQYEAITHNLANANTAGFKRRLTLMTDEGAASPSTEGPDPSGLFVDFTQGRLVQTGRPLDVALSGPGFLVLESENGPLYTRNGVLRPNATGQLVDAEGRTVAGDSGPIILPAGAGEAQVHVSTEGEVVVDGQSIGRLRIVEFSDTKKLAPIGLNAYKALDDVAPEKAAKTTVQQGFQEGSNVSPVHELVGLIKVTRFYEATVKALQAEGERGESILRVAMA